MIWERCPKTTFVGRRRLELAINDATISFNEGELARLTMFEVLKLSAGRYLKVGLNLLDQKRLKNAYVPGQNRTLKARRARAQQSKAQQNDQNYSSGKY
ncbi:hypothetical protein SNE40_005925 [Patella caerulea]|uniref:Uncharacterized protein n=1 Tax=Patella caerulea TaxID=87958 RepID=A0AAN8K027_PATCE